MSVKSRSNEFTDELCWAATWLYRATGEQQYLDKALQYYSSGTPWAFSWDDKNAGAQLMMYITTGDVQYASTVYQFLNSWRPGGGINYTPGGLAWRTSGGVLRYSSAYFRVAKGTEKCSREPVTQIPVHVPAREVFIKFHMYERICTQFCA